MSTATAAEFSLPSRRLRQRLPEAILLFLVAGFVLLSAAALYSVGRAHQPASSVYLVKQLMWLPIALGALFLTTRLRLEKLREFSWFIAGVSLLMLCLVLVPGVGSKVNGARRWINLGFAMMQVSDFVKIGFVFVFAHYFAAQQRKLGEFRRGFLYPGMGIGLVFGLLILQPDFGTAALFAAVGATLLFLSGARLRYLLPCAGFGVLLFGVLVWLDPVRLERITSFLHLEANRNDGGYQLWQGMLAFGSGGVWGVGLGNGRQPLSFLPEAHTDFIFAVIGEELGLVFTGAVVIAFALFFVVVALELRKARNLFEFLLVAGSLLFITFQAMINLGVVTGLLPTKGMSLPFVSYGGSNLVAMFVLVGLILNCLGEWNAGVQTQPREIHG